MHLRRLCVLVSFALTFLSGCASEDVEADSAESAIVAPTETFDKAARLAEIETALNAGSVELGKDIAWGARSFFDDWVGIGGYRLPAQLALYSIVVNDAKAYILEGIDPDRKTVWVFQAVPGDYFGEKAPIEIGACKSIAGAPLECR